MLPGFKISFFYSIWGKYDFRWTVREILSCAVNKPFKLSSKEKKAEMKRADYSGRRPPVFFKKEFGGGGTHCIVAVPLPMSFLDYAGIGQQF